MKEININIEGYNVNGICVGCLNYGRKMFYRDEVKECFRYLADIDVPDGLTIQVCWECLAAVRLVNRFQMQVLRAYDVLIDYSQKNTFLNSPLDLSQYAHQRLGTASNLDPEPFYLKYEDDDVKNDIQDVKLETGDEKVEFGEVDILNPQVKVESDGEPSQETHFSDDNRSLPDMTSEDDIQLSKLKKKKEKRLKKTRKTIDGSTMAWNPNSGIPREFYEVLQEDGEYAIEDDDDTNMDFLVNPNGTLVTGDTAYGSPANHLQDDYSSTGDESDDANRYMLHDISPITYPQWLSAPSTFERGEPSTRRAPLILKHSRGSDPDKVGTGRIEWVRGQPLSERFVSDEELPLKLREDCKMAGRVAQRKVGDNAEMSENEAQFEDFVWMPMDGWSGQREVFTEASPGPKHFFPSEYDAFRAFWDDSVLAHIVGESNRYAKMIHREGFRREWYPTNVDEILVLFAFWMMLGIIRMPTIKSCFSSLKLLKTDVFGTMFTEARYWNVNAALHFNSGPCNAEDPAFPIRPIMDHLNIRFKELYNLNRDVSIDESPTLWTKASKFGIKTYELFESTSGYLWNFIVYSGRSASVNTLQSKFSIVLNLIGPVLNKGHTLFMDSFFNSPKLARYLKLNDTDCVGTVSKDMPLVIQKCPLAKGEFIARQSGDVVIVAVNDRRRITCISTCHGVSQIQTDARPGRPSQYKLEIVRDYSRGIKRSDHRDETLEPYLIERKQCQKWSKKLFKRLLNATIQNSRILVETSTKTKCNPLTFRLGLISAILERHLKKIPTLSRQRFIHPLAESRLTQRHFIRRIPITDEMRASTPHRSNWGRRRCVLCTRMGRQTRSVYECPDCEVALCLENCFQVYHTVP